MAATPCFTQCTDSAYTDIAVVQASDEDGEGAVGHEAVCTVRYGTDVSEGRALLEGEDLCFRGDFRLTIPFADVSVVEASDGELHVTFSGGLATFKIGQVAEAESWAEKIRNPSRLIDMLDVMPGACVALLGVSDPDFIVQLRARTELVLEHDLVRNLDLIFVQAENREEVEQLSTLEHYLQCNGAIWVIAPKGKHAINITEMDVLTAGRAAGLTDTKVAEFSATHTAHKFVIPKDRR